MWSSLFATVWSPWRSLWFSCRWPLRNSYTLAVKNTNMTKSRAKPEPDSSQSAGFAHWFASYQEQLQKMAKRPDFGRDLSEEHKDLSEEDKGNV